LVYRKKKLLYLTLLTLWSTNAVPKSHTIIIHPCSVQPPGNNFSFQFSPASRKSLFIPVQSSLWHSLSIPFQSSLLGIIFHSNLVQPPGNHFSSLFSPASGIHYPSLFSPASGIHYPFLSVQPLAIMIHPFYVQQPLAIIIHSCSVQPLAIIIHPCSGHSPINNYSALFSPTSGN
jgi:hypothetical protein